MTLGLSARERPANMRLLTPDQEDAVRSQHDSGATLRQLAAQYGVTKRTICRTLHRAQRTIHRVEVSGYYATYEIGDEGPIQLTPWRAA